VAYLPKRLVQRGLPGRVSLLSAALVGLLLLLRQLLKHGLLQHRLLNRIHLERQQASQLAHRAAYRAAHARLSEKTTDGAA